MARVTFLDTHVAVWLFSGQIELLSDFAQIVIEDTDLCISPMVVLELEYLREVKKISVDPTTILHSLSLEIGLKIDETDFGRVIKEAIKYSWTRDPFDRIIAATASINKSKLLTKDRTILKNCENAIWQR